MGRNDDIGGTRTRALTRAWCRWAGRGNGQIGAVLDRVFRFMNVTGAVLGGIYSDPGKGPVSVRLRRIRRGAREGVEELPDDAEGLWVVEGQPRTRVLISLELSRPTVTSESFSLPLDGFVPIGTLDRSLRPRAVNSSNAELDSGVVLRSGDESATLLMQKRDLAVLAILLGWPSPRVMPHGQSASEVAAVASA